MKYYDTSALLRAWKEGWAPEGGLKCSHTVSEWISIQTGRGLVYRAPNGRMMKRNLSPADASREAQRLFAILPGYKFSKRRRSRPPKKEFAAATCTT